jgi:predicted DNA-binding protein with PD1-like motif
MVGIKFRPSPMRHQLLSDYWGQRTFAVVLETGDEAMARLQESVRVHKYRQLAHVRPTLEMILNKSPVRLQRVHDPQSELALIRPKQ